MTWLDEIEARLRAATPGPWTTVRGHDGWDVAGTRDLVTMDAGMRLQEAGFIAHAPDDITHLIAVARAAEAFSIDLECENPDEFIRNGVEGPFIVTKDCGECPPCRLAAALGGDGE